MTGLLSSVFGIVGTFEIRPKYGFLEVQNLYWEYFSFQKVKYRFVRTREVGCSCQNRRTWKASNAIKTIAVHRVFIKNWARGTGKPLRLNDSSFTDIGWKGFDSREYQRKSCIAEFRRPLNKEIFEDR